MMQQLQDGRLDMICTAARFTEDRKRIVDFSQPYFDSDLAIAIAENDTIRFLRRALDAALDRVREYGTYACLCRQWFRKERNSKRDPGRDLIA